MKRCLVLLLLLFLPLSVFSASKTADEAKNKLVGPLRELSDYYKTQSKYSAPAFLKFQARREKNPERRQRMLNQAASTAVARGGVIDSEDGQCKIVPIYEGTILLEEVQKNWGNPDFDVLSCQIQCDGDPDRLLSEKFKIISKLRLESEDAEEKYLVSAEFAASELSHLAALSDVKSISPVLRVSENNDQGTYWTGASVIRKQEGDFFTKGYTGEGTIVGVIDSGIDWTHEDFVDPATGTSRILYLWDSEVTTPGKTPADVFGGDLSGLTIGTVWTKAEIDAGLCTSTDTNGHGTHVTGSAAGNGYATGKYAGMAPNADIIFVKGLNAAGNNGALFIYELATQLGKPCTVNMSYGPTYPFHYISYWPENYPADNTSNAALFFQALNGYYGPGHIPVKAAGNNGHWNTYTGTPAPMTGAYHAEGNLASGQSKTHTYTWYNNYAGVLGGLASNRYPWGQLGIWYSGPIRITFISPNGYSTSAMLHGNSGYVYPASLEGIVYYTLDNPVAANGAYYGTFDFEWMTNPATQPTPGDWQIVVEPAGANSVSYDIWCSNFAYIGGGGYYVSTIYSYFTGNQSHAKYITHEGASDYMITVGNFATRNRWTDMNGDIWSYTKRPIVGQINDSSSPGPARDGRMKPDIAAPGSIILSTASKDGSYWATTLYLVDPKHGAMSGTSMASPHVAGGVALMLQKNPYYTVSSLRSTIGLWAHHDFFTDSGSPNAWGYGKFNVRPLNSAPLAHISVDKSEIVLDDMEYTVHFDGSASSDPEGFPLTYTFGYEALPLDDGAAPAAHTFSSSGSSATLEVDPEIEGRYRASLKVNDGLADSATVWSGYVQTRFYPILPPVNLKVVRVENDLILFKRYYNTVTWEANPDNKSKVDKYILYKKVKGADDASYAWVKDYQPGDAFKHEEKGLTQDELFTYKVVAVNKRGVVSDPIVAGN